MKFWRVAFLYAHLPCGNVVLRVSHTKPFTFVTCSECVNTTRAERVHIIATGKSYDELLQHDNKMRI